MTSALQMSSRKPPVGQSTFGFPDDSFLGARAFQPAANSVHPAPASCPTRNPKPETPSPLSPCSPCLAWSNLATQKNVEKLSFQARIYLFCRESENFFTTLKCDIFPHPTPASRRPAQPSTVKLETLSTPSRPWLEAPAFLRVFVSFVGDRKNVEKLSFHPRIYLFCRESQNFSPALFRPFVSHFRHFARFSRPLNSVPKAACRAPMAAAINGHRSLITLPAALIAARARCGALPARAWLQQSG